MSKLLKNVAGSVLIVAGSAKLVSLSGGDLLSLLFVFGIIVGTIAIIVGDEVMNEL